MFAEISEVYPDYYNYSSNPVVAAKTDVKTDCSDFIDHYFDCDNCQYNFIINRHEKYSLKNNIKDIIIVVLIILLLTLSK